MVKSSANGVIGGDKDGQGGFESLSYFAADLPAVLLAQWGNLWAALLGTYQQRLIFGF